MCRCGLLGGARGLAKTDGPINASGVSPIRVRNFSDVSKADWYILKMDDGIKNIKKPCWLGAKAINSRLSVTLTRESVYIKS